MDINKFQKELYSFDIDEDIIEEIMDVVGRHEKHKIDDNKKNKEVKELRNLMKIEADWKRRSIIASQIIKINL